MSRTAMVLGWVFVACTVFVSVKPGGWLGVRFSEWTENRKRARVVVAEWAVLSGGSRPLGNVHDSPRLVEFVDYRCPFCRFVHDSIAQVVGDRDFGFPMSVGIRYRLHPSDRVGRSAALAAICAAEQGRFEETHSYFLTDSLWLNTQDWDQIAIAAAVEDVAEWNSCRSSPRAAAVLSADSVWSQRLSVNATPTFVTADGTFHIGVAPPSQLRGWLQQSPKQ